MSSTVMFVLLKSSSGIHYSFKREKTLKISSAYSCMNSVSSVLSWVRSAVNMVANVSNASLEMQKSGFKIKFSNFVINLI